ncbi:hypothetical protein ACB092_03G112300 [Castanea dentata]
MSQLLASQEREREERRKRRSMLKMWQFVDSQTCHRSSNWFEKWCGSRVLSPGACLG